MQNPGLELCSELKYLTDKAWNICEKTQKGLFSLELSELGQGKDLDFFSHIQRKAWKGWLVGFFFFLPGNCLSFLAFLEGDGR